MAAPVTTLARISEAHKALTAAKTLDDVLQIRDQAEALRVYIKAASDSLDAANMAAEIKLRAERKAGQMLTAMEKPKGGRPSKTADILSGVSATKSLDDLGVTEKQSSRWQREAMVPEEAFVEYMTSCVQRGSEITQAGLLKIAAKSAVEEAAASLDDYESGAVSNLHDLIGRGLKYGCIYADPPWAYSNKATRANVEDTYKSTMSVDEICQEPVSQLAADDCHLHLWTTNAFLFDAKRVMEAWGFEYKSCFVWVKPQMGIGNYWRVSHEFMLLGIRGKPEFRRRDCMSWGKFDRTAHSKKPRDVRRLIESVSRGPYLELYGREAVDNWMVYGNEVAKAPLFS
jgi:N6-adenosine-specific RNA methylase IME4